MKSNNSNTKTFPKKAINKAPNKVVFKRVTIKEHMIILYRNENSSTFLRF